MPFSGLWKVVHPVFNMPANSMLLTGTCVTVSGYPEDQLQLRELR